MWLVARAVRHKQGVPPAPIACSRSNVKLHDATVAGSCRVELAASIAQLGRSSPPPEQTFHGRTLEEALAWCLVWLMAPEIGIRQFLV